MERQNRVKKIRGKGTARIFLVQGASLYMAKAHCGHDIKIVSHLMCISFVLDTLNLDAWNVISARAGTQSCPESRCQIQVGLMKMNR